MEKEGRTHDLYGEEDIPKSNFLNIEEYMDKHAKEIVDYMEDVREENKDKIIDKTGEIHNRIIKELAKDMPLGVTYDEATHDIAHVFLSDALISSLWCGWYSQSMANKNEPKFKREYLVQFARAITNAYYWGKKYANAQKLNESSKERC